MPTVSKPQKYRNMDSTKIIEQATHAQGRIEPHLIVAQTNSDAKQGAMMNDFFDRRPILAEYQVKYQQQ